MARVLQVAIQLTANSTLQALPLNLSARQFRFAFKTLLRIAAPPSPLAATQPFLVETLLEMLHARILECDSKSQHVQHHNQQQQQQQQQQTQQQQRLTLVLTLLDSLPFLAPATLEGWLDIAATCIRAAGDSSSECGTRLWEVVSTEMDVERSPTCVAWWSTRGGREAVLGRPTKVAAL